jgi:hypothetical protein
MRVLVSQISGALASPNPGVISARPHRGRAGSAFRLQTHWYCPARSIGFIRPIFGAVYHAISLDSTAIARLFPSIEYVRDNREVATDVCSESLRGGAR